MILDLARALNTAHFVLDGHCVTQDLGLREYDLWCLPKENPPVVSEEPYEFKWVRDKRANYEWAVSLLYSLCANYAVLRGREHIIVSSGLLSLLMAETPYNMPQGPFMDGVSEIPDTYAFSPNTVYAQASSFLEEGS